MVENEFYRRTIKVGNSAGVLLPKSLLGADVKVAVVKHPRNIKKETLAILNKILEDILGIFLISKDESSIEILAISTKINKHIERGVYKIDITPIDKIKTSIKQKPEIKDKIKNAKPIMNKQLLDELRK